MTDSREALLSRFRASLQARVRTIAGLFDVLSNDPSDAEVRRQTMGELHTLKGEARMLGFGSLVNLVHALETQVGRLEYSSLWASALDAMRVALDQDLAPELADAALENAVIELEQNGAEPTQNSQADFAENATPESPAGSEVHSPRRTSQRWVQVDSSVVDELCESVVELATTVAALYAKVAPHVAGLDATSHAELAAAFALCRSQVDRATTDAWRLRLTSIEPALRELSQHARALAAAGGKSLVTDVLARGVQMERDALDTLWESLLHLAQNAVDHGIERPEERGHKSPNGRLLLAAETRGANVVLTVEDDGRGIDCAKVRTAAVARGLLDPTRAESLADETVLDLLFEHGFSTKNDVTELSGRGVGLDVVRRRVEGMGGAVAIDTKLGHGTRFTLSVPFTVTKERVLVLRAGGGLYGLPSRSVRAILGREELPDPSSEAEAVLRFQGEALPLNSLSRLLGIVSEEREERALVVDISGRRYGLRIQGIWAERELVRRPVESLLARASPIQASAVLDDGSLVLLLDLSFLRSASRRAGTSEVIAPRAVAARRKRVLVADDSPVVRELLKEILMSSGLEVSTATDGAEALKAFTQEEPDLVLTDLEMPRMGGFELLAEIRRRSQRVPVVVLTTRGSVEDRQQAAMLGANGYVLKSGFKNEMLLDVVSRALGISL
ncbi:MAG: hybrid sensor histidine kinase/response regulator [Myxococcota bacterium]